MGDPAGDRGGRVAAVEALLIELSAALAPAPRPGRGRPPILPAAILWAALTIGVLRGAMSQAAVWRIVGERGLWPGPRIRVSDAAVYKRLARADPSPMAVLFAELTALLLARPAPEEPAPLAPFAAAVVVVDETTLDAVARTLPGLRGVPAGDGRLLPGKLAGVFDVRRRLWRAVELVADPRQNEKRLARGLVAGLEPGTLVLADLGSFGFEWFDGLTDAGHFWVSRLRAKTSYTVEHAFYRDGASFDGLVWLGAHRADRAKHLVRLVRFRQGGAERAYLTNVRDPRTLPLAEIARLYARRWDIELAVKLVKRELGLHLPWSAKRAVLVHQIWAALLIAQLLQALRLEVAARAGAEPDEVSLALLLAHLPGYAARAEDPIDAFAADGRWLGFIRPSRRLAVGAPVIPEDALAHAPPELVTTRAPRYAGRRCGPDRTDRRK